MFVTFRVAISCVFGRHTTLCESEKDASSALNRDVSLLKRGLRDKATDTNRLLNVETTNALRYSL